MGNQLSWLFEMIEHRGVFISNHAILRFRERIGLEVLKKTNKWKIGKKKIIEILKKALEINNVVYKRKDFCIIKGIYFSPFYLIIDKDELITVYNEKIFNQYNHKT